MADNGELNVKKRGYVFNIQQFSVHDGPGIRTIVFLKGCPLRCQWCSNPESQKSEPELAYNHNKCIGIHECGFCINVCPQQAVERGDGDKIAINREKCSECFRCADVCPSKALIIYGKSMTVDEVLNIVESDSVFYARSGGGITLSGGEPLLQSDFSAELLREARRRKINTSMETCGYARWSDMEKVCQHLNNILFDIKCLDPDYHKKFTGVANDKILYNLSNLCKTFPQMPKLVRTPVIPGVNDTKEAIEAIANMLKGRPNVQYELLAYHRLGQTKYEYIGREYTFKEAQLIDDTVAELKKIAKI